MLSRHLILGLILLTLLVTVLAASAKLRATPKYDRIQVGMSPREAAEAIGADDRFSLGLMGQGPWRYQITHEYDEGAVAIHIVVFSSDAPKSSIEERVEGKSIVRRGPLERLAWLAGWRE